MAEVNTSMYSQQPAVQFNPLQTMGQVAGIASSINQNKILQQLYGSNVAGSQQWMKAVGPNGVLDPSKAASGIAGDPNIINKGDAINQAISARAGQATATTAEAGASDAQIKNLQTKAALVDSVLYPVLSDPNAKYADGVATATKVFNTYPSLFTPQERAAFLSSIPKTGGPAALNDYANNLHARVMSPTESAAFLSPTPTAVDTGPQSTIINTNPRRNPGLIGAVIPKGLTPEAASAPVEGPIVNGQRSQISRQGFQDIADGKATIIDGVLTYKPGQTPGGVAPIKAGPGAITSAQAPWAGALQTGKSPTQLTQAAVPTGAPLGQEAAATAAAGAHAAMATTLEKEADDVPNQKAVLSNMEMKLKNIETGPLAAKINEAKAMWNETGGKVLPQFDPETIAAQQEFTKFSAANIARQSAVLGTDAGMALTAHANPNEDLVTGANKQILATMKGNQDAIAAKRAAWQDFLKKNGGNKDTYGDFSYTFNRNYTPRVFQFPYMAPAQRAELLKSMTPQEKSQYKQALTSAEKNGWLSEPSNGQ